ncbi:proton-conducting transporter membrane subunit [Streptomyces sp. TRM75563]|uniref:NADH-quinone oxidoreductase subunit 5 family protein n=1 Tax=Streptomyces sp. TRM75563 TaxID=2817418 RepID=UPI001F6046A5|nr:proton-conducting transporter membrane subunit [Streptomyces sp. TRM75563]MCI4042428.1 NADH-quinone oxidoreductase subunit L [Streptomyces sp. TRM75563]
MSGALWALIALPLSVGTVLLLAGRRADRAAAPASVAVMSVALGMAVAAAYADPAVRAPLLCGLPAELSVDGLSGLVAITVTAVSVLVLVFSATEFGPRESRGRFFGLMLLFAGSMLVTVTAATLPVLLMGWEVMGATSWALIGYWWRDPERVRAANTAFMTTRAADLGLYLAAGAALAANPTGTLALSDLSGAGEPWRSLITAGLITAALGKSSQLPFSFWLSRAMAGPSPVSALLHSATMVIAGAYLLLRVNPLLEASGWGSTVVAWAGVVTAIALGLVAVAQTDLKQLLAASSCAQIGFMVLAAGVGGTTGGTLQLIAHAAAKSMLFLISGAWLTALGTKTLTGLYGAARRYRTMGVLFTVGALSLAGLPPLSLWVAKDVLLAAAFEEAPALYAAGLVAALLSALYSVKALWFVWQPVPTAEQGSDTEELGTRHVPSRAVPPLAVLALACVALSAPAFGPMGAAVSRVLDAADQPSPKMWEWLLSAALTLGAAGAAWGWGNRGAPLPSAFSRFFGDWLHMGRAAHLVLVRPVLTLAHAASRFDDRVLDAAVRGAGREAAGALAHAASRFDDRVLDAAVRGAGRGAVGLAHWSNRRLEAGVADSMKGVASAFRSLGRLARRPQTGQLHQYLAQVVAALTVLALVFVLVK